MTQLYELVGSGEQKRNVELKRSMNWGDPHTKAKVVKTMLSMSNIRDGGYLIFGFDQDNNTFKPTGMTDKDLNSFNYDHVKSYVSEFADPYVEFSMETVKDNENSKTYLVFAINEFDGAPIICKKDGLENLQKGAIYTRSRRMPESVKVPTNSEMREIVDMATEKGIRKYVETAQRAGLQLGKKTEVNDYDKELEGIF